MKDMTAKEAAAKWGVSDRQVQRLLAAGRIAGARKYGAAWVIPANAPKPQDERRVRGGKAAPFFTLPRQSPQLILTTLYHTPGGGEATAATLAYDAEAQALFLAELAYFRCEPALAQERASALLQTTTRSDVVLGCCFILCLSAMYDGCAARWFSARSRMAQLACPTEEAAALRDFVLGSVDSGLYDRHGFPAWFREGRFDPLPGDCYPQARLLFLKWLMLSQGDPSVSWVCGPLISQSRLEGALLSEIYCRLLAAIGFHDRGAHDLAARHLDEAIALALPDRLYAPLIEYRNELGLLLDERLSAVDKAAAAKVRAMNKELLTNWAALAKKVKGTVYTTSLTTREHHAAKLAAKGLSNAEIASRMRVSVNSVKRYLSEALAKTGAKDRMELAAFIALEGETVP